MGMANFLTALFGGTKHDRDMKHLAPVIKKINDEEAWAKSLGEDDFKRQTESWKNEVKEGRSLDEILPKAFALAREAAFRTIGERHYDVQLMGAVTLHEGKIMELKTGEGKETVKRRKTVNDTTSRFPLSCPLDFQYKEKLT